MNLQGPGDVFTSPVLRRETVYSETRNTRSVRGIQHPDILNPVIRTRDEKRRSFKGGVLGQFRSDETITATGTNETCCPYLRLLNNTVYK